nr:hypothetical protein [Tanacetum cinerariifolium]
MARQCTQPKRPRNVAWYKDKAMLAEAQEARQILDEEQLAFLADPGVPDGQAVQKIIPTMLLFRLRILILMILTVMISRKQKRFSCLTFSTMVLTLSQRYLILKPIIMIWKIKETLILEEESRSKMSEKEKDPEAIKRKFSNKPIDYVKLNQLYEDFGKRFVPQQELSPDEAF